MKKALKTVFALLFAALIAAVSLIPAFAAKDSLKFNGTQAKVGDKVTYSLELGGCDELIEGFQMYVFFDSEKLKVVPDTLKCPEIPAAVFNDGVDGKIPVVFSSVSDKLDFSKKKTFLTVDFEVLSGGNTDITYFITELYGEDMTFLKKFETERRLSGARLPHSLRTRKRSTPIRAALSTTATARVTKTAPTAPIRL